MYLTTFGACFFVATLILLLIGGMRVWKYSSRLKTIEKTLKSGRVWVLISADNMCRSKFVGVYSTHESAREAFLCEIEKAYPDGFEGDWVDGDTFDADGDYYLEIEETEFVAR